uniref:Uncharacterized protein n=1 Tax=Lotus japonicus TaxID=34305 RepID=I3SLX6_LOTJA|nr:unknown [Lotus japonicus]
MMMLNLVVFQRLETLVTELFEAEGSARATVFVCLLTTDQKMELFLLSFKMGTDCSPIPLLCLCKLSSHHHFLPMQF